jgi:hypothetical protein
MSGQPQTGRVVAIVLGALVALAGLAVGAAGGALIGLFGSDGTVDSGSHRVSTPRTALVSSTADVGDISVVADVVGDPSIRVTARPAGGRPVFVGIGPAAQVERYLAAAPIDEVTDFEIDPFKLERRPRGGSGRPERPGAQRFWVAKGTGRDAATLRWTLHEGDYKLVLMNADASRGVAVDGDFGVTLDHVDTVAWALVGGGALLLLGGLATIGLAMRRSSHGHLSGGP